MSSPSVSIFADINGRLGVPSSSAVGTHAAELEDASGKAFHAILLEHNLVVPSTLTIVRQPRRTYLFPCGLKMQSRL